MSNRRELTPYTGKLLAPELDYILLDASGSMLPKWAETIAGLNAYVQTIAKANLNAQVVLTTFCSSNISVQHRDCRLSDWTAINPYGLEGLAWGGTPLYDAINIMGQNMRLLNPPKGHIIIVTDGEATKSVTSLTQAKAVLQWCRAKGWQITFLGADFANSQQAQLLGAGEGQAIGVMKTALIEASKSLGAKRIKYSQTGEGIHFDDGERQQFGGYLTGK